MVAAVGIGAQALAQNANRNDPVPATPRQSLTAIERGFGYMPLWHSLSPHFATSVSRSTTTPPLRFAFAILLIPCWALASTYYGYGMVPAEARRFFGTQFTRFWPGAGPAPPA